MCRADEFGDHISGQMNSAITFPAFENGHEVRLVGSPLDREIIDGLRKDNYHITLKRTLHDGIKYYQIEELQEALEGADLILGGVSSFGLDWFCDEILPVLPEEVPLLTVTKGMVDLEDGTLVPYPTIFEQRQPAGKHINFNAIGGPCTSYELAVPAPVMSLQTMMTATSLSAEKIWRHLRRSRPFWQLITITSASPQTLSV